MDLELSDEQRLLTESLEQLLARADDDAIWRNLVEFGALDLSAVGAVELALVARSLGGALIAVPYVDSAAAHYALRETLPATASVAACLDEPGRPYAPVEHAVALGDGRMTGERASVSFAASVDLLAVPVDEGLALVRRDAAGVTLEDEETLDPSLRPQRVRFEAVEPEALVGSPAHVEMLASVGGVLASAESVGAAAAVLELARNYAGQRRQFGRTIGSFQALRHLLADMHVKLESSWSSILYAAASLDEAADDALPTASIAKAYAARATRDVAHGALQVFGGIAFTAEHPAHRHLRRIVVRSGQFGTAFDHERDLGRSLAAGAEVMS